MFYPLVACCMFIGFGFGVFTKLRGGCGGKGNMYEDVEVVVVGKMEG